MNLAAFVLLATLLATYAVLDGYDLGIGALHLIYARTKQERAASFSMIGPFWSGNEVLLITFGAALFALFPRVYAAAFSGFYLPLVIVLWLFMVRGMAIELRGHLPSAIWSAFWDAAFGVSSMLLCLVFGLAVGNIIRGVPLDASGYFAGSFGMLLNWYGICVALLTLSALAMHGAAFACWRLETRLRNRALAALHASWWWTLALLCAVTAQTFFLQRIHENALLWVLPVLALLAFIAIRVARNDFARFAGSALFIAGLAGTAAATIFPFLLPALSNAAAGLSIYNGGGNHASLTTGFAAAAIGLAAAAVYGTLAARRMLRRI